MWSFTLGAVAYAREVVRVLPFTFAPWNGSIDFNRETETRSKIARRQGRRCRGGIATAKRPDAVLAEGIWSFTLGAAAYAREVVRALLFTFAPGSFLCPSPKGGAGLGSMAGRGCLRGEDVSMELLRATAVVVVLLLLLLIAGLATCAAGRPRSVVDGVPAAVKGRPDALQRCLADGGQGRAV